MIRFAFRKGLRFIDSARNAWTLVRKLVTNKIQLEDDQGDIKTYAMGALHDEWLKGNLSIDEKSLGSASNVFYLATPRDLETYDERNKEIARYKHEYLSRLVKQPKGFISTPSKLQPILDEIAVELKHKTPPRAGTVYRWWKKYCVTKCITKLTDGRLNSGRRINAPAYSLFEESLYEVYLSEQKDQGKEVVETLRKKVQRANENQPPERHIKMPGDSTVYRWLKSLHAHLLERARLGKELADINFRASLKKLKVSRILERVEIDHTPLDLIVIDKATNLPLGRPWLTLAIDRCSRMILGFYICFHAPSSFSVLQCIKHAILPKESWLERFPDIKEIWPARGIPEQIATDNGMDLHCDAFEKICLEIGIEILYCPAGHPYLKGAIESMFRTMNQWLIHRLPGTVSSNIHERGSYASEELAAIDFDTLTHLLTKWIVEVYHRNKHRGLGMSPLAKWVEEEQKTVIELPAYPQQLDVLVGIPTTRTLWHYGIELDYLYYNSPELHMLFARHGSGKKYQLKYYESDVGYIHVYEEDIEEYIRVPAVDLEYASGLSKHMHMLIREHTKKNHGEHWTNDQLIQSKTEIQEVVAAAVHAKKMNIRKSAAVANSQDSESANRPLSSYAVSTEQVEQEGAAPPQIDPGLDDDLPSFGTTTRTGTGE